MKTLVYLFGFAMLLFAGCAKDEMFDDNMNNPELKKAKVPIPMKVDICGTPDWNSGWISYGDPAKALPIKMIIGGNGTRIGKFNSEKSYWIVEVYQLKSDGEGKPILFQSGTGFWVAANGDNIKYTWWVEANALLPTLDFTGEIELLNGTGKFAGCSGTLNMAGKVDVATVTICYTADGFMKFN